MQFGTCKQTNPPNSGCYIKHPHPQRYILNLLIPFLIAINLYNSRFTKPLSHKKPSEISLRRFFVLSKILSVNLTSNNLASYNLATSSSCTTVRAHVASTIAQGNITTLAAAWCIRCCTH